MKPFILGSGVRCQVAGVGLRGSGCGCRVAGVVLQGVGLKHPSRIPAEPQQNPSRTPAEPQRNPSRTPAEPQQNPSRTLAEPQQNPSRTLAEHQQNPSRTPAEPQQNPSRALAEPQQNQAEPSQNTSRTSLGCQPLCCHFGVPTLILARWSSKQFSVEGANGDEDLVHVSREAEKLSLGVCENLPRKSLGLPACVAANLLSM